jgi:hypothetical protein
VHQVGYLQELNRDARSTEHKRPYEAFRNFANALVLKNMA